MIGPTDSEQTAFGSLGKLIRIGILISGSLSRKNPSFQWCVCAKAAAAAFAHWAFLAMVSEIGACLEYWGEPREESAWTRPVVV